MGRSFCATFTSVLTRPICPQFARSSIWPLRDISGLGNYRHLFINNPEAIPLDSC